MSKKAKNPFSTTTIVALDFETTGVNFHTDTVIEVGAVKFRGDEVVGELSLLVNPKRTLDPFVSTLTGIKQEDIDGAPTWDEQQAKTAEFLGDFPILAHNAEFEKSFMKTMGLPTKRDYFDTLHLAATTLDSADSYSLINLAKMFDLVHDNPHRALSDADVTRRLFLILVEKLAMEDESYLALLVHLSNRKSWLPSRLASLVLGDKTNVSPLTLDTNSLSKRLDVPRKNRRQTAFLDTPFVEEVEKVFDEKGALSKVFTGYVKRQSQLRMASLVAHALSDRKNTLVEAGTGVGKSLAYLIPAALYAQSTNKRVLVSTYTMNLQEQLLSKDWEVVKKVSKYLNEDEVGDVPEVPVASKLKGRSNYLCLEKLQASFNSSPRDENKLSLVAKCLRFANETSTGDRADIRLGNFLGRYFTEYSAEDDFLRCPKPGQVCFFRKAKKSADNADVIIVNHSLLMSEIELGGQIPECDVVIVDEAHHLRDVATSHLTFEWDKDGFSSNFQPLAGKNGALFRVLELLQKKTPEDENFDLNKLKDDLKRATDSSDSSQKLFFEYLDSYKNLQETLRITPEVVGSELWSKLTSTFKDLKIALTYLRERLNTLSNLAEKNDIVAEFTKSERKIEKFVSDLTKVFEKYDKGFVFWINPSNKGKTSICGAPLMVGKFLEEKLFSSEKPVVLVGATLSVANKFDSIKLELGIQSAKEEILESNFNYYDAALVLSTDDIPAPNMEGYKEAVIQGVFDVALATNGRTLVLFTSRSAMDNVRQAITHPLNEKGVDVFYQDSAGAAHRTMENLANSKNGVALGLKSMWEGVDMAGIPLSAVVLPRLPFPVPVDPIHAARGEMYEDGFMNYSVPEAVKLFRQAFGRLIRSNTDRGVFVILDSRYATKRYGGRFSQNLPHLRNLTLPSKKLHYTVKSWLSRDLQSTTQKNPDLNRT